MFYEKAPHKDLAMITGNKHLCWSLCLVKLQASRPATLLNTDSNKVFSCVILRSFYEQLFQKTKANVPLLLFTPPGTFALSFQQNICADFYLCDVRRELCKANSEIFYYLIYNIYCVIVSSGQPFWSVYFT